METVNHHLVERTDFYQRHLDQVSRSFAFCIRQLREPLRGRVALAYLLCRVLDTVEDASDIEPTRKFRMLGEFRRFIETAPSEPDVQAWVSELPKGLRPAERDLMEEAYTVFADFHALPQDDRKALQETILSMANGMEYFLRRSGGTTLLRLGSLREVNRYCFFVAGVVGEMLTKLLVNLNRNVSLTEPLLLRAHQFGLFLQKINILKDQMEDEKAGRCLIPSQEALWRSLESDMQGALEYLLEIPIEEREYRLFCGWSLFLGLASVPWIRRTWARKVMDKIPRAVTEQILGEVTRRIDDNRALQALFEKMRPESQIERDALSESREDFGEFGSLYLGRVSREHLLRLGM